MGLRCRTNPIRCGTALLSLAVLLAALPALAQQAPDAGSILRDIQRTTPRLEKPPAPPSTLAPPVEAPILKAGQAVRVTGFRIHATLFPEAVLLEVVKDYIGRDCTLGELQEAAAKIGRYYREHDYFARAYLPKQSIEGGVVEIVVQEAKLGRVSIDPASPGRLDPGIASGRILARQEPDQPLRPGAVEAGLASVNSLPGVATRATLLPGAAEGVSDLMLTVADTPLVSGLAQIDNASARSIGSWRELGSAALNDPLGIGDQETVTLLRSNGSEYGRLAVALPVSASGLTLGANASYLKYAVDHAFSATDSRGSAISLGGTLSHPLWHGEALTADASLAYDHKRLISSTAGTTISDNVINAVSAGVSGSGRCPWIGGSTGFGLTGSLGRLDLGHNSGNEAQDALSTHSEGGYAKVTANFTHHQPVAEAVEAVLGLSGQWAGKNLDSSEKFALGGPAAVRAFPVNEANGDEGWLASAELRYAPLEQLQLGPFIDAGAISLHKALWPGWQVGAAPNSYNLYGTGFAATWTPAGGVSLKATLARVLGNNPGHSATGSDADGRHEKTRLWLQAAMVF